MSSSTHPPVQRTPHMFSPSRSERTRTLESTGEFASPTIPIPTLHTNGQASGSGSNGNHYIATNGVHVDPQMGSSVNGNREASGSAKPEKKRKKKGWKGWVVVVEDDAGNILEENDGPEPDPLPSSRTRNGRNSTGAPVAPKIETPVVKNDKSPTPHTDGQISRGSAPPMLPTPTSPKKTGGYWKKKETPILAAPRIPEQVIQSVQPGRQQKRSRPFSLSTSPLSPQSPENPGQVPKTAHRPTPRHSLPKAKPVTKKPRPSTGNTRAQPTRGDTQPSTARATPIPTPNDLPAKVTRAREDLPNKQLARPMEQTSTLDAEIRHEATMLVAQAEERRQMLADSHPVPDLSSPNNDDLTPASSTRLIRPMSPSRTGQRTPRIRTLADDDDTDPSDDFDAAFDADFEKVKEAYTRGIRPCNNPLAPQEHSVPIYGLEDASPPEWQENQPPTVITAPRRDRVLPDDPVQRGHRLGLDGMTHDISVDSEGFITNIKNNIMHILDNYFPEPGARTDAFVEDVGRGLTILGQGLTDSGAGYFDLPPQ